MHFFYDTCALLNKGKEIFNQQEKFYISSISLKELEEIKTSFSKDGDTKYKARRIINLLVSHQDKYETVIYQNKWDKLLSKNPQLSDNNDSRIIISALTLEKPVTFVTQDLCCYMLASSVGLTAQYLFEDNSDYSGYKILKVKTEEELNNIYTKIFNSSELPFDLNENEYLLIKDKDNKIIDKYKMKNQKLIRLDKYPIFESSMFGKVKPIDDYQYLAMDSLLSNKITMLRGAAGTGKSYLAMGYLISQLEKGNIDRIIIFCNTVAANGAAKLGFYPGSKDEKLLDSQIGNFLISKLGGDKDYLIDHFIVPGKIVLLPLADIRGYDSLNLHAGIYITEAQNLDIELMRLALQRIGEDSICIIDGDDNAQVDLSMYAGINNGMKRASKVFRGEKIYGEVTLPIIHRSQIARIAQRM